jgi:hypothetical protein
MNDQKQGLHPPLRQAQAGCDNAAAEPMKQPADLQPPHSTQSRDQAAEHMYYIDGSRRRQPPPRSALGWDWIAKACWRLSAAP